MSRFQKSILLALACALLIQAHPAFVYAAGISSGQEPKMNPKDIPDDPSDQRATQTAAQPPGKPFVIIRPQTQSPQPLSFSWKQISESHAEVEIMNDGSTSYWITPELSELGLRNRTGDPIDTKVIEFYPSKIQLGPGTPAKIRMRLVDRAIDLAADNYSGYLILKGTHVPENKNEAEAAKFPDRFSREAVNLLVESSQPLEPLVGELTLYAYRVLPWPHKNWWICRNGSIPIKNEHLENGLPSESIKTLSIMQRAEKNDSHGIITLSGTTSELLSGRIGLDLSLKGMDLPGTYKGEINLNPYDKQTGVVKLTAIVSDMFAWPLLTLILGILVAAGVERLTTVILAFLRLKERLSLIEKRLNKTGQGTPESPGASAPFSTERAFQSKMSEIRNALKNLSLLTVDKLDDDNLQYKNIKDELDKLESQMSAWEGFETQLKDLRDALKRVEAEPGQGPGIIKAEEKKPRFLSWACWLLEGRELSLEQFVAHQEQTTKATELANDWVTLNEKAVRSYDYLEMLKKEYLKGEPEAEEQTTIGKDLKGINRKLIEAWCELWYARDAQELESHGTKAELDEVDQKISSLYYLIIDKEKPGKPDSIKSTRSPEDDGKLSVSNVSELAGVSSIKGGTGVSRLNHLTRIPGHLMRMPRRAAAKSYSLMIRVSSMALFILSMLLSIYAGMEYVYFGKPFGTWQDYLRALTWGLATKTIWEAARATLTGVANLRQMLPTR